MFFSIKTFDYEGITVVRILIDLMVGLFYHLDITSNLGIDRRIKYTERILTGPVLVFFVVLLACKDVAKGFAGYQWILVSTKYVIIKYIWNWENQYRLAANRYGICVIDYFKESDQELRFGLGKSKWKKYQSKFHDYVKYIHNNIQKPFMVGILHYTRSIIEMKYLAK